jgi:flagellar hook-associated protein 3 FlgL
MRIAGTSYTNLLVNQLNVLTSKQFQLQGQVSTGQRIQNPEDDPAGMAQALRLQADSSRVSQYAHNVSTLQSTAGIAYDSLQQLKTISDRAGEIATLADGTKTPAQLQAYATEINQLIQRAVQLANGKEGNHFLFSGTRSDQPPFAATVDANNNVTAVNYQGNAAVAQTEVADGTTMTADTLGANTTGAGPRGLIADSRYGADLFNHLISLRDHLTAGDTKSVASVDHPALVQDEDNLIYHISNNGVLQTALDSAANAATTTQNSLQQSFTKVTGVDMTKAITDLSQAQSIYKAALQSSSILLQLQQSVMQYL